MSDRDYYEVLGATVKPCILVPQSGTMLHPLRRFAAPLCGAKKM